MAENVSEYIKKKYGVNLSDEDMEKIMSSIEPSIVTDEGKEPASIESQPETEDKGDLAPVETGQEEKKQDALTAAAEEIRQKGLDKKTADWGKYFEKEFQADKRAEQEDTNNLVSDIDDYLTKEVEDKGKITHVNTGERQKESRVDKYHEEVPDEHIDEEPIPGSEATYPASVEVEDKYGITIPDAVVDDVYKTAWGHKPRSLKDYDVDDAIDLADELSEKVPNKAEIQKQSGIAGVKTTRPEAPEVSNIDTSSLSPAKPTVAPVQTATAESPNRPNAPEPVDASAIENLADRMATEQPSIAMVETVSHDTNEAAPDTIDTAKLAEVAAQQKATPVSEPDIAPAKTVKTDAAAQQVTAPASAGGRDNSGAYTPTGDYQKDMAAIAAQEADNMRQNADELSSSIVESAEKEAKSVDDAYTPFQKAIADRNKSIAQAMLDYKSDIDALNTEMQQGEQASRKASRAAAYGELAAAFINLAGVMGGANNAKINNRVSTGWMQQAEEQARERRHRIPSMRDRLRSLQSQLETLKAGDAETAFKLSREKARTIAKAEEEAAKVKAAMYQKASDVETKTAANLAAQEHAEKRKDKQQAQAAALRREINQNNNYAQQLKALGQSGRSVNKVPYHDENGNLVFADMKSDEFKTLMSKAFDKARKDPVFMEQYEDDEIKHDYERFGLLLTYAENDSELRQILDSHKSAKQTETANKSDKTQKAGSGLEEFD